MIRTTKHILKFANKVKLSNLEKLYQDYSEALQICVSWIYDGILPTKTFMTSKELPKSIGNITHSRWRALIYKQASSIIRSAKESYQYQCRQRFNKVYRYFKKNNRHIKFLGKYFYELNIKKFPCPELKRIAIVMDYRFTELQTGNYFDKFMKLHTPYFIEGKRNSIKIKIPIKLTKMDLKYKDWNKRDTVIISKINNKFYANFIYEKPLPEKRKEGIAVGIDFGKKKLLTTSRGEFLGIEIENICKEIVRCKQGSNHYKRLLCKRNQYIDKSVKSLNLKDVSKIIVEDLKGLKKNACKIGMSNKEHRKTFKFVLQQYTFLRLRNLCEEHGIELVKVSPAYTSQRCSRCGIINKFQRKGEIYTCKTCGMTMDADINGSLNILHRGVYSPSNAGK